MKYIPEKNIRPIRPIYDRALLLSGNCRNLPTDVMGFHRENRLEEQGDIEEVEVVTVVVDEGIDTVIKEE